MKQAHKIATAIGEIAIESHEGALARLHLPGYLPETLVYSERQTPLSDAVTCQLHEYFAGTRRQFDLPLRLEATPFLRAAWSAICEIGFGRLCSYGDVANRLASRGAARAVGMACRNNPIPLVIPCHRVVAANGALTGFFGGGLSLKQWLIAWEASLLHEDAAPGDGSARPWFGQ
ncbi:methylated-DNA--[protein]-cysteine S-methyltransferase [Pandoraea sp. ISTKB]|uniref:methylated-DNA--[protein]-cysteine S-methyltransferase n=1 Tax=Pandoraea sp. ISTKB TaxID=1586708 RepID=UPI0008479595|nr:methylated-DNA--[protein]-cysteine S-methyltransferase [Pandoraea sp. ISTKB]ODP34203.1 hypothetical protein A9762_03885 [Pandoraea sp. ISTKB]